MNIAIIGTGYVGLVSGACFADFGHSVICVDADGSRVSRLEAGEVPFYEPGVAELVQRNAAAGRLRFTTETGSAVRASQVVFLAVGTPEGVNGAADLSQMASAAAAIAAHLDGYCVIVTKSTVPVGTGEWLGEQIRMAAGRPIDIDIVSNPEFLREGSAINDFMRPDRVVIGTSSERAAGVMRDVYRALFLIETPILVTDVPTAEMIKCASNAFLAVKISFMNEIANLCDRVGADVHGVAKGMGLDKRIGSKFLHPGPGYGGSCFPKDTRALAALGSAQGVRQQIVESAIDVNERQRQVVLDKISNALGGVHDRTIAVLGLAFKPNTSDVREAPALYICRALARAGARLRVFDPVAGDEAAHALDDLRGSMIFAADAYDAASGADAVVIMTEWNEFRSLDLPRLKTLVGRPVLIDTRNVLDPSQARALGFTYACTGREMAGEAVLAV
ncbi:MAG: UDP-glucose/GDP-mannose dehydrogenase family protein [Acidobacteria bacterium]|nr:UDP-glucose/GDP-mannose dehydrogenase family protein [Acidobacteriota bacterium]